MAVTSVRLRVWVAWNIRGGCNRGSIDAILKTIRLTYQVEDQLAILKLIFDNIIQSKLPQHNGVLQMVFVCRYRNFNQTC